MWRVWWVGFILVLVLSACGSGSSPRGAAGAVEAYYKALVEKDSARLSTLSCSSWESSAQTELAAFGSVKTVLKDFSCTDKGTEGKYTLVGCKGKIIATYQNENQDFPLDGFTYLVVQEGGSWRVCGTK
ncbi:MAG TPA: hypothetical protein VIO61_13535 [Anaerolineaceae bacterium]